MNKLTLNAAVKRHSELKGQSHDEIVAVLKTDPKNFTDDEILEIIAAMDIKQPEQKEPEQSPLIPKKDINNGLGLEDIDYMKFAGVGNDEEKDYSKFEKYQQVIKKFPRRQNFDFEKYNAVGVFITALNKNMDKYKKFVGVRFVNSAPECVTRCPIDTIEVLNHQIGDVTNNPANSIYYLLKKPVK
jgi:hypothetical protein